MRLPNADSDDGEFVSSDRGTIKKATTVEWLLQDNAFKSTPRLMISILVSSGTVYNSW